MEQAKSLYFSKDFFDIQVLTQDSQAYAILNQKTLKQSHAYRLDRFIRDEMVMVYEGETADLDIVNPMGESVVPLKIRCACLCLAPTFFGRGYVMRLNGRGSLALTVAAWALLIADTPKEIQH